MNNSVAKLKLTFDCRSAKGKDSMCAPIPRHNLTLSSDSGWNMAVHGGNLFEKP